MKIDLQLEKPLSSARVVVAMSGGVDSSVAAALCAASGAETIGVTLQLYDHGAAVANPRSCCAGRDIHDARDVAARSEEHTSELQSLMRISYAVFCLKKKKHKIRI